MEDGNDYVVKEIPLYISKQLSEHLYLYQYPLKLAKVKDDTVKIKSSMIRPLHQQVNIELALNTNSINYDVHKAEEIAYNVDGNAEHENEMFFENNVMDKQSFISLKTIEDCSKYGVGYIHENEIHVTPLKGIIQFRPNFPHLDRSDKKVSRDDDAEDSAKQVTVKFARPENDRFRKIIEKSYNYLNQKIAEEPWYHTKWHHASSDTAELERTKLLAESDTNIGQYLDVTGEKYLKMLIPASNEDELILKAPPKSSTGSGSAGSGKSGAATLSLLDHCQSILKNVKIITFQQLMHLLNKRSVLGKDLNTETVLRTLPQVANLVRGCWVVRSDILYPKGTFSATNGIPAHVMCRTRDYVLHLFSEKQFVDRTKIETAVRIPTEEIKEIFTGIAQYQTKQGWAMQLETDLDFIKKYPDIVKQQQLFWETKQKQFNEFITDVNNKHQFKLPASKAAAGNSDVRNNGSIKRNRVSDASDNEETVKTKKIKMSHKTNVKLSTSATKS